ncbi:hypothetical protein JCM6882_007201 [Rhodosporidiobolus microsporus]
MDESPLAFVDRWTQEVRSLQAEVQAKPANSASLSESAQRLSQQLTDRTGDLPLSELARCERELKALQDSIAALKSQAAPKSKFSFKRAAPAASSSSSSASPTSAPLPPPAASVSSLPSPATPSASSPIPPTALTLSSLSSSYLSHSDLPSPSFSSSAVPPQSSSSASQALALSSLTRCFVDLLPSSASSASETDSGRPSFSALYLSKLEDCVVLLPVTSGSILIQEVHRCLLVLGGHQFRMHDSTDCRVFLQAGSTPIIERCRGLVFGGYPSESLSPAPASLPPKTVQDFDDPFATPERPSPNWRFASADEARAWGADARWSSADGRREAWSELLNRAVKR